MELAKNLEEAKRERRRQQRQINWMEKEVKRMKRKFEYWVKEEEDMMYKQAKARREKRRRIDVEEEIKSRVQIEERERSRIKKNLQEEKSRQ